MTPHFKVKFCLLLLLFPFFSCKKYTEDIHYKNETSETLQQSATTSTSTFAHPSHIIFVWFENKKYSSIVGSSNAPYINSLIAKGTLFTNMHAVTHPSYPNYMDFFGGQSNGITSDACISGTPFSTPNLYVELLTKAKTFAWYSEDLAFTGSRRCTNGYYVEKHNPTTVFTNVPKSQNKRFADFPTDYTKLENVVCISPNLLNDMHDGSVLRGDQWLKTHLSSLAEWCRTHNSIFVVYFDENDGTSGNQIPAIAIGQPVKVNYKHITYEDHYNWTRTICAMFYAPSSWTTNLSSRSNITGCWQ